MAKSIRFSGDVYLTSKSVVYGTTRLDKKLEATDTAVTNAQNTASSALSKAEGAQNTANSAYILEKHSQGWSDGNSHTVTIENNCTYIYINSHTFMRCVLLITTFTGGVISDVIFKSADAAVPSVSMSGNKLTITQSHQARGCLYKIRGQMCA